MSAYDPTLDELIEHIGHHLEGEPSPVPSTAHVVLLRRAKEYLEELKDSWREMDAVWKYLNPNMSNDMPWSDEIILAHDQAVLEAEDRGRNSHTSANYIASDNSNRGDNGTQR